jgi:hypothetical protein
MLLKLDFGLFSGEEMKRRYPKKPDVQVSGETKGRR